MPSQKETPQAQLFNLSWIRIGCAYHHASGRPSTKQAGKGFILHPRLLPVVKPHHGAGCISFVNHHTDSHGGRKSNDGPVAIKV
ncbi:MAG: hypothetical protein EBT59_10140 [Betaproteobacteria bacterium]|nr:hypothetical protein [Betaproteobacteria bacterium]NBT99481.1 hypothetical protein [Betaproteobacteria bacterium]